MSNRFVHSAAYYTHDGNKNVSEVVAADDTIAAHYEYAPFGALTSQRGESAVANPWRFSSEYAKDETGTVHGYDAYGRLVSTTSDRDPTSEYTYDSLGARIATTRTVDIMGTVLS